MKLPLHLNPNDFSPEATEARALHAYDMQRMNPTGFRTKSKRGRELTFVESRALSAEMIEFADTQPEKKPRKVKRLFRP